MADEPTVQFKSEQRDIESLNMMGAINAAKTSVETMTGQQIDSIVKCCREDAGDWTVCIDVIESFARMGDNDLLATYQVQIDAHADLVNFSRLRRYHREDQDH